MLIKSIKAEFSQKLIILAIGFTVILFGIVFLLYTIIKSKTGPALYNSYLMAYRVHFESTIKSDLQKALQLKQFVESEILERDTLSAAQIEKVLRLSNIENSLFYSLGIYLKENVEIDTSGGFGIYVGESGEYTQEILNTYLGLLKIQSFDKISKINQSQAYNKVLNAGAPLMINPYEVTEFDDIKIFVSFFWPIKIENKTIGFVKLDLNISSIDMNAFDGANFFSEIKLLSNNGIIAANTRDYFIGRSISEIERNYKTRLIEIHEGISKAEISNGKEIKIILPFDLFGKDILWQLEAIIDDPPIFIQFRKNIIVITLVLAVVLIVFQQIVNFFFKRHLAQIYDLVEIAQKVENGEIDISTKKFPNNELGLVYNSFIKIIQNLKHLATIAVEIGNGNLNLSYGLRSEKDLLGKSIMEMEKRLKSSKEEEQQLKEESTNRSWISGGLAEFGMRLKNTNVDTNELLNSFLSGLVEYVGAVQGSIFKLFRLGGTENNWYLELLSAYAYHQNKFLEKKVHLGEGLVGMCAKERQPVIIKDVPGNYIFIKSAFGGTVPQNIVLIPLIFNDLVYGVLELATLAEFENYKVEFLEQLAENIANTLAIDETNEQTKKLLEQTQKQSQELLSREEELRQNLEELQSTQDRFLLNQAEMNSYMNALNLNQMVFELNASFLITHTNANFADFLELPTDVLFKFAIDTALGFDSKLLDELKRSIFNGDVYTLKHTLVVGNKNKRFKAVLSPVFNDRSVLVKIVGVGYEIV